MYPTFQEFVVEHNIDPRNPRMLHRAYVRWLFDPSRLTAKLGSARANRILEMRKRRRVPSSHTRLPARSRDDRPKQTTRRPFEPFPVKAEGHFSYDVEYANGSALGVLRFYGEIGANYTAADVRGAIRELSDKYLRVEICSEGGKAMAAVDVFDALVQHPLPVECHVLPYAMSGAALIALAGDEIVIPATGVVMFHRASDANEGTYTESTARVSRKILQRIESRVDEGTAAVIRSHFAAGTDYWLSAATCNNRGIATRLTNGCVWPREFDRRYFNGAPAFVERLADQLEELAPLESRADVRDEQDRWRARMDKLRDRMKNGPTEADERRARSEAADRRIAALESQREALKPENALVYYE